MSIVEIVTSKYKKYMIIKKKKKGREGILSTCLKIVLELRKSNRVNHVQIETMLHLSSLEA